jgi:hypothetical protein
MYDQTVLARARQREDQQDAERYRLARALLAQRRVERLERSAQRALHRAGRAARLVAA